MSNYVNQGVFEIGDVDSLGNDLSRVPKLDAPLPHLFFDVVWVFDPRHDTHLTLVNVIDLETLLSWNSVLLYVLQDELTLQRERNWESILDDFTLGRC